MKIKGDTGAKGDKGDTGAAGAAGKGIKAVTNHYLASTASSGVTTSTSGWTTTIQTITETKKYLWNYETITYTDNSTTSTSPCIIGVYGNKGATGAAGATGKGIKSITEHYAVSASNTTAPTSWSTSLVNTINIYGITKQLRILMVVLKIPQNALSAHMEQLALLELPAKV